MFRNDWTWYGGSEKMLKEPILTPRWGKSANLGS